MKTITKYEFLKHWFNNQGYRYAAVVQGLIGIQTGSEANNKILKDLPNSLYVEDGKFKTIKDGEVYVVEGDVKNSFTYMHEKMDFEADFHPVLQNKKITSTFGLMLANVGIMYEAFGTKVEYINQTFTEKVIAPIISRLMVDNGPDIPADKASVDDCLKFNIYSDFFRGLSIHYVKPGGVDTLMPSESVTKLKEELLKKHKDELNDPVVFTSILERLVELDLEEQLKGKSKDFYISKGLITNNRKRMFGMFGVEPDPDNPGKYKALTSSLDEGIDPEFLVEAYNESIVGVYARGKLTAKGGAQVKDLTSLFGRIKIIEVDCGTKVGETLVLNKDTAKDWLGSWYMEGNTLKHINEDTIDSLLGKKLYMRVPQYCRSKDGDKCERCVGDKLGALRHRLGAEVVNIAQKFQLISMKLAHTSSADLVKLDLERAIKI